VRVALPDVLEHWYRELVEVTDAGRVFVVSAKARSSLTEASRLRPAISIRTSYPGS
jgi:hypothetical protein